MLTEIRENRAEIKALRAEQQDIQKSLATLKVKVLFVSGFVGMIVSSVVILIRSKIGKII